MRKTDSVLYIELAPQEFLERLEACPVAYLPLGTLEWHGPHLPLGTDLLQGDALFRLAAEQFGGIVMPGVFLGPDRHLQEDGKDYYGMDVHIDAANSPRYYPLQQLPGSAYWLPDELYDKLIEAIVSQLARAGFRVVVGCGHGPSTNRFIALADKMWEQHHIKLVRPAYGRKENGYIMDHAGKSETSNIMHFYPELVHMERLPDDMNEFAPGMGGEDPRIAASAAFTAERLPAILEDLGNRIREALKESK